MPTVEAAGLTLNYDEQGAGEPLLLIPYTSADHACYAFQLPALHRALPLHQRRPPPARARAQCTSTRFAEPLAEGIPDSTVVVFDDLCHAALHEDPETFNGASLEFLLAHRA